MKTYFKLEAPYRGYAVLNKVSPIIFSIDHITTPYVPRKMLMQQICREADTHDVTLVAHSVHKICNGFGFTSKFDTHIRPANKEAGTTASFCEMLHEDTSGNYITVKYRSKQVTHVATVNQYGERLTLLAIDDAPDEVLSLPYL